MVVIQWFASGILAMRVRTKRTLLIRELATDSFLTANSDVRTRISNVVPYEWIIIIDRLASKQPTTIRFCGTAPLCKSVMTLFAWSSTVRLQSEHIPRFHSTIRECVEIGRTTDHVNVETYYALVMSTPRTRSHFLPNDSVKPAAIVIDSPNLLRPKRRRNTPTRLASLSNYEHNGHPSNLIGWCSEEKVSLFDK